MNPTSRDFKDMIVAGLGLVFATDLFYGREPTAAANANCVTIFDTPGGPPDVTLGADSTYDRPSINIRVRNTDYGTGWALIDSIKTLLHGKGPETWNGTLYHSIVCSSEPALLDWDKNNRARFFTNFQVQRS
jgi:hypothetical protein